MEVSLLRDYIGQLEKTLAAKIQQQREYLQGQLDGLAIYANNKAGAPVRAVRIPRTGNRAKPKYQSKKDQEAQVDGEGDATHLDARRDEGYEADEGRFCDQMTDRERTPTRMLRQ
jgi:hypothetical protein